MLHLKQNLPKFKTKGGAYGALAKPNIHKLYDAPMGHNQSGCYSVKCIERTLLCIRHLKKNQKRKTSKA